MTAQPEMAPVVPDDTSDTAVVSQKRKLSDIESEAKVNGSDPKQDQLRVSQANASDTHELQLLGNVYPILESHDIDASILQHSLTTSDVEDEPASKRPKLDEESTVSSIASKFKDNTYQSRKDLQTDVDRVCESIIEAIHEKAIGMQPDLRQGSGALQSEELDRVSSVLAFQRFAQRLLEARSENNAHSKVNGSQTNGINVNGVKLEHTDDIVLKEGRPVLSIFANAQGSKQLFSSLQREQTVELGQSPKEELKASVSVSMPIAEAMLPTFLTLSRTGYVKSQHAADKEHRKFGDVFGQSVGRPLPDLQVPKPANRLLTKSSNVNWITYESLAKSAASRPVYNWSTTKQTSGKWLSYGTHPSTQDSKSPEAKRRQRDRALSTSAAVTVVSEESVLAEEQGKEEALFRNAFSSFAPTVDNSGATVTHHVKNNIWWEKVGRQRAADVFIDPAILAEEEPDDVGNEDIDDDKTFEETVENFDPSLLPTLKEVDESQKDDVDAKLEEITNLIDTLYSYQKIRNSQLPSTTVPITPVGSRQPMADMMGTPGSPSIPEVDIYKSLKAKLAMLVLDLPPYAVSRMKGDKYGDLAVSTSILLETDDDAGMMEDDSPATKPKPAAAQASNQPPSITPRPAAPSYGPQTVAGSQYGRTPAAAPVPGRGNSTYYPHQSPQVSRTPSISYNRGGGSSTTNYGTYPPAASRPSYGQPNTTYNSTPSRPSYSQTPSYGPQQAQQAIAANRPSYGQYYQPGAPPNNYNRQYSTPTAPSYGPRPQPQQYGYNPQPVQSPNMHAASPMQQNNVTPAPQYNRTPVAQPQRPQYYGPPQASALGPSGFHTSMTPQEQQSMMDRQRAQVAIQNQARQTVTPPTNSSQPPQQPAASNSPQRQMSATPPNPNFPHAGMPQVNGTTGI